MSDQTIDAKSGKEWTTPIVGALVVIVVLSTTAFFVLAPKLKDRATIEGAQKAAAAELRDPSSAQFRNVRTTGYFVCGEINGKNGFGAYAGFVRFYGTKDFAKVDPGDSGPTLYGEPIGRKSFEMTYKSYCES